MPLYFEQNLGQAPRDVAFVARGSGRPVAVSGASLRFGPISMRLVGAKAARLMPESPLAARVSYFVGADPEKWIRRIPAFARIRAVGVYDGVDLVYYGNRGQLEFDLIVRPGVLPERIEIEFAGANSLGVDASGALVAGVGEGVLRCNKPLVHQGAGTKIEGAWAITGRNRANFKIARYDESLPLTIDPVLEYAGAVPGAGFPSSVNSIAVDSQGNTFIAGSTRQEPLPEGFRTPDTLGENAFVAKLNAKGSLSYIAYIGGPGEDSALDIAVDAEGSAIVSGSGQYGYPSFPEPARSYGGIDAFIAKLSPSGDALSFSKVIGGQGSEGAYRVIVEPGGLAATVVGYTNSLDFPLVNPIQSTPLGVSDGWVARLRLADGRLVFSTRIGTPDVDWVQSAAISLPNRSLVIGGYTFRQSSVQTFDCLVGRLTPSGEGYSLDYLNRLGGSGFDACYDVAADAEFYYVAGATRSTDLPVRSAWQASHSGGSDMFLAKLEQSTGRPVYLTYLGSRGADQARRIVVENGFLYFAGTAGDAGLATADAIQPVPVKSTVPVRSLDGGETWQQLGGKDTGLRAITSDPANADHLYAVGDELYRSADGGVTWNPMSSLPLGEVPVAIAAAPGAMRLYVGTNNALFYSADGGTTWNRGRTPGQGSVRALVADPSDPTIAYAKYDRLLVRSFDGGANWSGAASSRFNSPSIVAVNQSNPRVLWATMDAPMRSADRGATWSGLPLLSPLAVSFAAAPSDPLVAYYMDFADFYFTADGGSEWVRKNPPPSALPGLAVSPSDPSVLFGAGRGALFKSSNGGDSWTPVSSFPTGSVAAIHIPAVDPARIYVIRQSVSDGALGKLSPSGSLEYFTYLGSAGADSISALAVANGAIHAGGQFGDASSFPLTGGLEMNRTAGAFLARIAPIVSQCNVTAAASSPVVFDANGGTGNIVVQAPPGCAWQVSSTVDWLIPSPSSGAGAGRVWYALDRNPGPTRTGAIRIGPATVEVSQAALTCSYSLAPTYLVVPSTEGSAQVSLLTDPGCPWSFQGLQNFRYATVSQSAGLGPAQLTIDYPSWTENPGFGYRESSLRLLERGFFLVQQVSQPVCASSIQASPARLPPTGGMGKVLIKAPPDCNRDASYQSFLYFTSGQMGAGDGELEFEADINLSARRRSQPIIAGGLPVMITQDGSCGSDTCPFPGPRIQPPLQLPSNVFEIRWRPIPGAKGYQLLALRHRTGQTAVKAAELDFAGAESARAVLTLSTPGYYTIAIRGCTEAPFGQSTCGAYSTQVLTAR